MTPSHQESQAAIRQARDELDRPFKSTIVRTSWDYLKKHHVTLRALLDAALAPSSDTLEPTDAARAEALEWVEECLQAAYGEEYDPKPIETIRAALARNTLEGVIRDRVQDKAFVTMVWMHRAKHWSCTLSTPIKHPQLQTSDFIASGPTPLAALTAALEKLEGEG